MKKNKEQTKKEGMARAAKKLSGKTNLSERQMKASMASGDRDESDSGKTGNDYVNVQQGEVSRAELVQGQRNVAKLESTKTNNATEEKKKLEKSEKNFKKSKNNKLGVPQGDGEGGSDELNDVKNNPPRSDDL